jgi:hypothetical protein
MWRAASEVAMEVRLRGCALAGGVVCSAKFAWFTDGHHGFFSFGKSRIFFPNS